MKEFFLVLMIACALLGCEPGDEYHIQYVEGASGETSTPEDEEIKQSDHKLPPGALNLSNVPVDEFAGTWVHYSKKSAYYKNLDEIVPSSYSAKIIHLSTDGGAIVKRNCEDHPDSVPYRWIKTEYHLDDMFGLSFSEGYMRFDGYHYFDDGRLEQHCRQFS